jgi:hypothetical protein
MCEMRRTTGNQCMGVVVAISAMVWMVYFTMSDPFYSLIAIMMLIPQFGMLGWGLMLYKDESNSRIIQGIEFIREDTVPIHSKCRMVKA